MARFEGCTDAVVEAIADQASLPDWLLYSTNRNAKLDVKRILKHRDLWRSQFALHPSLSFTKKQMGNILLEVAARRSKTWPRQLTKDELRAFADTMQARIRTMARHISAAKTKNPETRWIRDLLDDIPKEAKTSGDGPVSDASDTEQAEEEEPAGDEVCEEEAGEAAGDGEKGGTAATSSAAGGADTAPAMKRPAATVFPFVGFDEESQKPWRAATSGPAAERQWGELVPEEGGVPSGPALARFSDGTEVRLQQITNAEVITLNSVKLHKRGNFWLDYHKETGAKLRVARPLCMRCMSSQSCVPCQGSHMVQFGSYTGA